MASEDKEGLPLQARLHRLLLEKYSGLINSAETKTVGEIKALVNPDDLTIQALLSSHRPENYSFPSGYLQAASSIYDFIANEISYATAGMNLNFWLTPKEILKEKIGDDSDLAVLLCSLLFGLGDENAFVVVAEMNDLSTHAFVVTEFEGKMLLLDPSQKKPFEEFFCEKADIMQRYEFNGSKIKRWLYKFNSRIYEQFI